MTGFQIDEFKFDRKNLELQSSLDWRFRDWPAVYLLDNDTQIYVGESLNVSSRLDQHLKSPLKQGLRGARVVLDDTFHKSATLDLESFLIRMLAGDGRLQVLNRNEGIVDRSYYGRDGYQELFNQIFEELKRRGLFSRTVKEIENTDLFKLSPFKAPTADQQVAIVDILEGLFEDLEIHRASRIVVDGEPGTGKTVVGIYLMKLLSDVAAYDPHDPPNEDNVFSDFFNEGFPELLQDFKMALVVPQQALRASVRKVFAKTQGLRPAMVMTPFELGASQDHFDLVIVDEAHRLTQRANQSSGLMNAKFRDITVRLFGADDRERDQLDWVMAKSRNQIFLMDSSQRVRPMDVSTAALDALVLSQDRYRRRYRLTSQMRVRAGDDYVGYVRAVLGAHPPRPRRFEGYDLRYFDDFDSMLREIKSRETEVGLARLLAGYAWKWLSKKDRSAFDISLGSYKLRWNQTDKDWVNSPGSVNEVGSIHTIQGYDLNYAGVIVGRDLCIRNGRIAFDRAQYFDTKGVENNPSRGLIYTDEDVLDFVRNIYAVLLTRGMRGTYVHVVDPELRDYLRPYFAGSIA